MTNKEKMNSIYKTARIPGFLYLIHIVCVFIAGFTSYPLIEQGDAVTTANNIMANGLLFRIGIVSELIGQVVFMLIPLVLYKLLKPVNKNHALLMVIFALVGVPIAMLNTLNQFATLLLLSGADYLTIFTADHLHAQVMLFLDLQEHGIFIAQIFWGLWLFPLGHLVFKSGYMPRILGVLLIIASFGYLLDCVSFFLFPNFDVSIFQVMATGEFLLPLWLLIKGVNVEQWKKRALESA
jgi:hypothetical protein